MHYKTKAFPKAPLNCTANATRDGRKHLTSAVNVEIPYSSRSQAGGQSQRNYPTSRCANDEVEVSRDRRSAKVSLLQLSKKRCGEDTSNPSAINRKYAQSVLSVPWKRYTTLPQGTR